MNGRAAKSPCQACPWRDGYKTEAQLKTATRLYAMQHPRNSISVVIGGATHKVR